MNQDSENSQGEDMRGKALAAELARSFIRLAGLLVASGVSILTFVRCCSTGPMVTDGVAVWEDRSQLRLAPIPFLVFAAAVSFVAVLPCKQYRGKALGVAVVAVAIVLGAVVWVLQWSFAEHATPVVAE